MSAAPEASSWFSPIEPDAPAESGNQLAFGRLWQGFMTARVAIAAVLLMLMFAIYVLGRAVPVWLVGFCLLHLGATLAVRLTANPKTPGPQFDPQWATSIGVDVLAFSVLQFLQAGGVNYAPLFALPVLMAAVLGSMLLALATAAGVTLLLLADAWWVTFISPTGAPTGFLQAALTGSGLFIVAFLTNQLASRLSSEEQAARRNQRAVRAQMLVNELVIENLTDGVLVTDIHGVVKAANPAARQLLGATDFEGESPFSLISMAGWHPLAELARRTFKQMAPQVGEMSLLPEGHPPRRVHARTRLTARQYSRSDCFCVIFLQDLREMEARLRTEKLAAMGRMSAAVAHEIRNPLAAITQANALLDEDLSDPAHKRLTQMVRQNSQRLARIVEDVLNLSRVRHKEAGQVSPRLALDTAVELVCTDWAQQAGCGGQLAMLLNAPRSIVPFDADHLHRILVNLLDNALRYASPAEAAIQVVTRVSKAGAVSLHVWSDGAPMERSVQEHLFEPFFSSESRSSGLGLYICRELCSQHGSTIGYLRRSRRQADADKDGNEFTVEFAAADASFDTIRP
ncbi:MAG: PAS domain-containing sensor histidine kinase [Burkholderiales bacterium]|nr:PAS domain-containing sensor histidine kinase [Burkholderiales bacterium]